MPITKMTREEWCRTIRQQLENPTDRVVITLAEYKKAHALFMQAKGTVDKHTLRKLINATLKARMIYYTALIEMTNSHIFWLNNILATNKHIKGNDYYLYRHFIEKDIKVLEHNKQVYLDIQSDFIRSKSKR